MKKFEYDLIEIKFSPEMLEILQSGLLPSEEDRIKINQVIKEQLNRLGSLGWKLHENSGLTSLPTIIVYKEKGVKNDR